MQCIWAPPPALACHQHPVQCECVQGPVRASAPVFTPLWRWVSACGRGCPPGGAQYLATPSCSLLLLVFVPPRLPPCVRRAEAAGQGLGCAGLPALDRCVPCTPCHASPAGRGAVQCGMWFQRRSPRGVVVGLPALFFWGVHYLFSCCFRVPGFHARVVRSRRASARASELGVPRWGLDPVVGACLRRGFDGGVVEGS